MTVRTRNWLIALVILAFPFVLFFGCLLFLKLEPLAPLAPLPNPNGYDDLVRAGQMVTGDPGIYGQMNEAQLRDLTTRNAEALQLLHAGLSNQCRVPVQFSVVYEENHVNDLVALRRLALTLAAKARLAEMEGHPGNAAESYLEVVHLGIESPRGGQVIDQLVGTAFEAIGVVGLQGLIGQLDAKTCREAAATMETLDAQRQSWNDVMLEERYWSLRTFPGIGNELGRLVMHNSLKESYQLAEEKLREQNKKAHQLMINLAARAYELDKGKRPANVAALMPEYLKAIPQDPVTGTNLILSP